MTDEMSTDANEPATKGDLGLLKGDFGLMKGDVGLMKGDIGLLKGDVGQLKDEFRAFRAEFGSFRAEMRDMFRPIQITLAHHTAELADIRGYLKDKVVTRDEFHSRMDGFTGRVDDFDYSSAKNRARIDEHEKRISALETKHA